MKVENVRIGEIKPYKRNAKRHPPEQVEHIANSIREFGWQQPLVIDKDGVVVIGHGRLLAAKKLGMKEVPCVRAEGLTEEQIKALRLADNKTNESEWDIKLLAEDMGGIFDIDMSQFGFEPLSRDDKVREAHVKLSEAFIVPPVSILDARQAYWQERKTAWKALIGDNGKAREGGNNLFLSRNNFTTKLNGGKAIYHSGSSILDPVLCEVLLTWFVPSSITSPQCCDVFAGDAVFGFVAGYMGGKFIGIELRAKQVAFNQAQADMFSLPSQWICDDGRNVLKHIDKGTQDFFFSCPPYFDLEVYSDKPNDASNQKDYTAFYAILDEAFSAACACLKPNRFACVVLQDVRGKNGCYMNFPHDVIATFERNGFKLYNHLILLRSIGSAALFARSTMNSARKTRNVHEDVLVFYNGDDAKELIAEDPDAAIDALYGGFAQKKQNIDAYDDVLVFYNGKESSIKQEFGNVTIRSAKEASDGSENLE